MILRLICPPSGTKTIAPSTQFSDSLFRFDPEPDRLIAALQNGGFTLNYVLEDFFYLGISGLSKIAFPMICFCDIPDRDGRLGPHMNHYGHFGIGLRKEWGIAKGMQPVHYLADGSPFAEDLRNAIGAAAELSSTRKRGNIGTLASFLVSTLAYLKPVYGINDGKNYCFEDECEWRYIATSLPPDMPSVLPNPGDSELQNFSITLRHPKTHLLKFDYGDITRIFVNSPAERQHFEGIISGLGVDGEEKSRLKGLIKEA